MLVLSLLFHFKKAERLCPFFRTLVSIEYKIGVVFALFHGLFKHIKKFMFFEYLFVKTLDTEPMFDYTFNYTPDAEVIITLKKKLNINP